MTHQISERIMNRVRWVLAVGWLLLVASLFYDPISPWLTDPNTTSPLRAKPEVCIEVQGQCIEQQAYSLAAPIFWGLIVPSSIFILLVFGHELWRRICPLSFFSQIPRALGIQRRVKRVGANGNVRYELARVQKDSWLAHNHMYLQFGWFFIGLSSRILFVNADRLALAGWLLFTIAAAIGVGYFYSGKSWCNYFCPMSAVQRVYGEPGGLLTSAAHLSPSKITQSMCREIDDSGQEKSACVACQSPCIDIDSQRSYWHSIHRPDRKLLYYGYFGLVIGYFFYYYLYAGNWAYYLSGVWAYEVNQLETLLSPGFYIAEQVIPIPKLIAVPLTLGLFTVLGVWHGLVIERWLKSRLYHAISLDIIQHRIFTLITFLVFNYFFLFASRSWIDLLPIPLQYLWDATIILASSIWVYRTWKWSPERYNRESLALRLRKHLAKLELNIEHFLEGRSLESLSPDEIYVLAKVLPELTHKKRIQAYKGVLKEALAEGCINTKSSVKVLGQMRSELEISDSEHYETLTELGVEDPSLLNPDL